MKRRRGDVEAPHEIFILPWFHIKFLPWRRRDGGSTAPEWLTSGDVTSPKVGQNPTLGCRHGNVTVKMRFCVAVTAPWRCFLRFFLRRAAILSPSRRRDGCHVPFGIGEVIPSRRRNSGEKIYLLYSYGIMSKKINVMFFRHYSIATAE